MVSPEEYCLQDLLSSDESEKSMERGQYHNYLDTHGGLD